MLFARFTAVNSSTSLYQKSKYSLALGFPRHLEGVREALSVSSIHQDRNVLVVGGLLVIVRTKGLRGLAHELQVQA